MTASWNLEGFCSTVHSRAHHPAIIAVHGDAARTWTSAELVETSWALSAGLITRGFSPGDRAVICAPNTPAWIAVALGIQLAGGVLVAIDDQSSTRDMTKVLGDCGARFVFLSVAHLMEVRDGLTNTECIPVLLEDEDNGCGEVPVWRELCLVPSASLPQLTPEMPACLFYTSGTTGAPKSFILTHANIAAAVIGLDSQHLVSTSDKLLMPLPFHHIYPWVVGVLATVQGGATIVLPEAVSGPQIVHAARLTRATVVSGVPRLYDAIVEGLQARLSVRDSLGGLLGGVLFLNLWRLCIAVRKRSEIRLGRWLMAPVRRKIGPDLRILGCGGARLEPATAYALEGLGFQVLNGYGLAETASIFTANFPRRNRLDTVGRPFIEGSHIRIADKNAEGIGEVQLKGPSVFKGYRNNDEANAQAFSEDGWFRTGDLGFLDGDGYLTVTGRSKELIILAGGKNIEPEYLENTYGAHAHIAEVAILERSGELVALVRLDREALKRARILRPDDAARVALAQQGQQLASYQRPVGFALVTEPLPRTRLGKLQRFKLPALFESARSGAAAERVPVLSADDQAYLRQPVVNQAWAVFKARYPRVPLYLDANLALDVGIDSFERMALVSELEGIIGEPLSEEQLAEAETVRHLLDAVQAAGAQESDADESETAPDVGTQWLTPPGHLVRYLGVAMYGVTWVLMRLLFRLRTVGSHRLPANGPFILTPNHGSDLDPLAVVAALSYRRLRTTYWAGDVVRLFASPVGRLFCRASHIFPADERRPAQTLAIGKAVLSRGLIQVWFPEAWRSPDGKLQRFMPGIAKLLIDSGAPAVPVFIAGAYQAMPRQRRIPKLHPIRVTFGDPVDPATLAQRGEGDTEAERVADGLRRELVKLARH